ncbi:CaiB/BaiF CoA transferase family protein [Martelella soudanensis]|uniref:CaiB/BaiF CoA transferase family protein n=1 Tax=unclassified Martelella TaxID=2629616 RepID=UPI0015DF55E4|nr:MULTISPECIES: CoA transferase [unclassified Martelella]
MPGLPLQGIKVVDFSRVLAGPLSTQVLGDLGADVIKIEHPERGDDTRDWGIRIGETETTYYYAFNRNKRSVALDLGDPEMIEAARALVADADVVVENFKQGGMERFGLGFEELMKINPRIIYCSIAGYDRAGEEAQRPGYDLVVQGESGLMSINGEAGRPPLKFGVAVVDMFAGMYAAQAILAALVDVQRTGRGRRVDLALYDCGVTLSAYYGLDALVMKSDPPRYGNAHPSVIPYGVFDAADGPLVIAVGNNRQFQSLCRDVLGRTDMADDPRFATNILRSENRSALIPELERELLNHKRADLLNKLAAAGIPCGEVLGLYEALSHPRTEASNMLVTHKNAKGEDIVFTAPPWRIDGERCRVRPPPTLGEHTAEVLASLKNP